MLLNVWHLQQFSMSLQLLGALGCVLCFVNEGPVPWYLLGPTYWILSEVLLYPAFICQELFSASLK